MAAPLIGAFFNVSYGVTVREGIVSFAPQCSRTSVESISSSRAASFNNFTEVSYITETLIPTMIPGWVFGGLALIGFACTLVWLCVACCRRCCRCCVRQRRQKVQQEQPNPDWQQFIAVRPDAYAQDQDSAPAPLPSSSQRRRRTCSPSRLLQLLLLLLTLAVVGVAAWGMADSITSTNSTVSEFWGLVDRIEQKVDNATVDLATLYVELKQLEGNLTVLTNKAPVVARALRLVGVSDATAEQVVALIQAIPDVLASIASDVQGGIDTLQDNIKQTVDDIQDDWEDTTMDIEDKWRFIPITVLFGLLILLAAGCCLLCWRPKPRRGALLLTCLLWLDVALLMLLGAGLMRGVNEGATDGCLYVENLLLDLARRKIRNPKQREQVLRALRYYFGVLQIEDSQVVDQLLGVPTYLVHEVVDSNLGQTALPLLGTPGLARTARGVGLTLQESTTFANISVLVPAVSYTVSHLESQTFRSSWEPLYHDTKQYICCNLNNGAYDVWVAWTVVGSLGFALALLCTGMILGRALARRKRRRQAQAAAAPPPAPPPFIPAPPARLSPWERQPSAPSLQLSQAGWAHTAVPQAGAPPGGMYGYSPGPGPTPSPAYSGPPLADQPPDQVARRDSLGDPIV